MADNNKMIILIVIIALFLFSNKELLGNSTKITETPGCNPIWEPDSSFDSVTFCSKDEAVTKAAQIGCQGFHTHEQNGEIIFMSCAKHSDLDSTVMSTY